MTSKLHKDNVYDILKVLMVAFIKSMSKNSDNIMSFSIPVDNSKIRSSLLYILQSAGEMEIMRLAKLLYLSDYLYAKTFGNKHGFMGDHKRYEFGPVPSGFYPAYDLLEAENIIIKQVNTVSVVKPQQINDLTETEIACIDKTLQKFSNKDLSTVKKAAYKTEPMKSIQIQEANMGSVKLMYEKMDFKLINIHPLFDNETLDIGFMNDPGYQANRA